MAVAAAQHSLQQKQPNFPLAHLKEHYRRGKFSWDYRGSNTPNVFFHSTQMASPLMHQKFMSASAVHMSSIFKWYFSGTSGKV